MYIQLADRLSVFALRDLASACPSTLHALDHWLDQAGFWLADLSQHPRTPNQVSFMIGFLGLSLAAKTNWALPLACQSLRDHMRLHQLLKEAL